MVIPSSRVSDVLVGSLPELAPSRRAGLPRFRRAGPSTSLDEWAALPPPYSFWVVYVRLAPMSTRCWMLDTGYLGSRGACCVVRLTRLHKRSPVPGLRSSFSAQSIWMSAGSKSGSGKHMSRLSSVWMMMVEMTRLRYHLRFAGMMYQGAQSVLVLLSTSS